MTGFYGHCRQNNNKSFHYDFSYTYTENDISQDIVKDKSVNFIFLIFLTVSYTLLSIGFKDHLERV